MQGMFAILHYGCNSCSHGVGAKVTVAQSTIEQALSSRVIQFYGGTYFYPLIVLMNSKWNLARSCNVLS